MSKPASEWDFAEPYCVSVHVHDGDIDAYAHVNNSVYLSWFDRAAWAHSASLGISLESCLRIRRGMAAHRTEVDYLKAAIPGDVVQVATWITATDARLRVERRFQVMRVDSSGVRETLARARTEYVCIHLDTGRAARMPASFSRAYRLSNGTLVSGPGRCGTD